jgi:hypothetical protein
MKNPKFKEVSRYADWFKNYRHLLGLPEGWTAGKSRETGDTHYINKSTGASQYEYPEGTPEGWGCPAVSNLQMRKLDSLLKKEKKPLLMWIYEK